jgi:hypothetical protein
MPDLAGPIFIATDLERAVIDTLIKWLPFYVPLIEDRMGREAGDIPLPITYTTRRVFTKFPEDQLPTIIVVSPGLDGEPKKGGDGTYRAKWVMHVGCVVSTSDLMETNVVSKIMGAAIRAAMTQHASLGGVACGMDWYDESYDPLPDDDTTRSLGAAALSFRIEVDNVVNWQKGPDTLYIPDPDAETPPGSDWPEAETVTVEIEKEAL